MTNTRFPEVDRPRARVPAAEAPKPEKLLGLAVAVVIVAAFYFAREVLIPITLAVLLSFILAPLVALLLRLRVPKVAPVLLAVVVALGAILVLAGIIGTQLDSLAHDLPLYRSTIIHKVDFVRGFATREMHHVMARVGGDMHGGAAADAAAALTPSGRPKAIPVEIEQPAATPLDVMRRMLAPVLSPLETIGIVFVVAIFILLQREDLRDRLIRLFGSNDLLRTTAALDDAVSRLSRYYLTQLGINAAFGVLVGVGLALFGVPSPILWGVLATLLRFVPYIGPAIAAILPVALAAAVEPGWSLAIWTSVLFVVSESVMGQVVEPFVYGHATGLSPIAVVVVAIFWTWIWGPIGLLMSTPVTLCLVVLGRHVEHLEFLNVLFGDPPALTPIESFYQRLLADDEDEVLRQAEALLKQRSLSLYYDDVALKGLQLAAADIQRDALSPERVRQIDAAIGELVHDLDEYDDVDPAPDDEDDGVAGVERNDRDVPKTPAPEGSAPAEDLRPALWRSGAPILCLAGRGPLDAAASRMLAQLLGKRGLGARVSPHFLASRAEIGTLDPTGVAMVCVSHLELSGNPVALRYLLRRLRQQLPGVALLVGLWPKPKDFADDGEMRNHLKADFYATSLTDAVAMCLVASRDAAEAPLQDADQTKMEPEPMQRSKGSALGPAKDASLEP